MANHPSPRIAKFNSRCDDKASLEEPEKIGI
jgi:hypothetical protein